MPKKVPTAPQAKKSKFVSIMQKVAIGLFAFFILLVWVGSQPMPEEETSTPQPAQTQSLANVPEPAEAEEDPPATEAPAEAEPVAEVPVADETAEAEPVTFDPAQFQEVAEALFSPAYTESITSDEAGAVTIQFKQDADYFETGDKINKIFTREVARLFRDVPMLELVSMNVPTDAGPHIINVTRAELEQHYGVTFTPDMNWREFLRQHDSKEERAEVVALFGSAPEPLPEPAPQPAVKKVKFRSCAEAREAGYSNMRKGEEGYSSNLDRDNDGIACDK